MGGPAAETRAVSTRYSVLNMNLPKENGGSAVNAPAANQLPMHCPCSSEVTRDQRPVSRVTTLAGNALPRTQARPAATPAGSTNKCNAGRGKHAGGGAL